jgi:hypothetical protein
VKLLSQTLLAATTSTDILSNPTFSSNVILVHSVHVTCAGAYGTDAFRLSLAPNGVALASKQYIYYDVLVTQSGFHSDIMLALVPGDVLRAYASSAICAISLFGEEVPI